MKPTPVPRVSIGLPLYNGEKFLVETIESLLAQTYDDFELIISDNASTDATPEICQDYTTKDSRIRYVRNSVNAGAAWNFNNTFHLSRGEYFKWAADDDLHHPQFIEKCVEVLDQVPSVVLCFTRTNFINEHGELLEEYKYPVEVSRATRRELFRQYTGAAHVVHEVFGLIRANALQQTSQIGGYVGSDLILLGKLALLGEFHQIDDLFFLHREHDGRSAKQGAEEFTNWFDTSKTGRFVLPYWRCLFENAKSVIGHPMGLKEKATIMWDLCRTAKWNRRTLTKEVRHLISRRPS